MSKFYNGYVINPESFWRPAYRISPFNTSFVKTNYNLLKEGHHDQSLLESFFGNHFTFCSSGKQAIQIALAQYNLKPTDEVWIVTTTRNKYISSCVTQQIEKFCNWSRQKTEHTRLIFVNHEFGFCFKNLEQLKSHGLPIIEDRALSFYSTDADKQTGTVGDFVIYSLPKFFPINYGGVLQGNNRALFANIEKDKDENTRCLSVLLSHYLKGVEAISLQRNANYKTLSRLFAGLGLEPRFTPAKNEVPGVFMFTAEGLKLPELKTFMQSNGIESSVFYGEEAFYLPVHQGLQEDDFNFFYQLVSYFIKYGNQ